MKTTQQEATPPRDKDKISLFNPLRCGDKIELSGKIWAVGRSIGGWKLHA